MAGVCFRSGNGLSSGSRSTSRRATSSERACAARPSPSKSTPAWGLAREQELAASGASSAPRRISSASEGVSMAAALRSHACQASFFTSVSPASSPAVKARQPERAMRHQGVPSQIRSRHDCALTRGLRAPRVASWRKTPAPPVGVGLCLTSWLSGGSIAVPGCQPADTRPAEPGADSPQSRSGSTAPGSAAPVLRGAHQSSSCRRYNRREPGAILSGWDAWRTAHVAGIFKPEEPRKVAVSLLAMSLQNWL